VVIDHKSLSPPVTACRKRSFMLMCRKTGHETKMNN
jgi:hypothetical protein